MNVGLASPDGEPHTTPVAAQNNCPVGGLYAYRGSDHAIHGHPKLCLRTPVRR